MTKLQVIENPKTVEEYLANIDKRLERITQLLSAALGVLSAITALIFFR